MSSLYTKESYIIDECYISGRIVEYDVQAANINILLNKGIIDESYYHFLQSIPKIDREIAIGNLDKTLQKTEDIKISKIISAELLEYRKKLFEYNNLEDSDIIRIAKDAVYVMKSYDLKYTQFDNIIFRKKMVASSMLNLFKILIFCWYNDMDQIEIDVVGINKNLELHQNGILVIIANTMYLMEKISITEAIKYLQKMYDDYVNLRLPIDYYRRFDPTSCFDIKGAKLSIMFKPDNIEQIDISYNLNYLRELYRIVLSVYTSHN